MRRKRQMQFSGKILPEYWMNELLFKLLVLISEQKQLKKQSKTKQYEI